jgi:hypothetical protein
MRIGSRSSNTLLWPPLSSDARNAAIRAAILGSIEIVAMKPVRARRT